MFLHETFAQFRPQTLLERLVISLNVLCLQIDDHQQYEEMFISYAHPFMGVWRVGYQRAKGIIELTKLNELLWSQCYWDTLSQTHTACVPMTILWNGGTAVWWYDPSSMSHVALPWIFARILLAGSGWKLMRGLMDLSVLSEVQSCVGEGNPWCVGKRELYIYMYVCIYWSKLSVPFRRDSVCLTLADI